MYRDHFINTFDFFKHHTQQNFQAWWSIIHWTLPAEIKSRIDFPPRKTEIYLSTKQNTTIKHQSKHRTTLTIRRPIKKTSRSSRRAHFNCASFVRGGQVSSSSSVTASLARSSFVLMTDHNSSIPGPDVDIGAEFLCRRRRGQQIHNVAVCVRLMCFLQCVELIWICVLVLLGRFRWWGCNFELMFVLWEIRLIGVYREFGCVRLRDGKRMKMCLFSMKSNFQWIKS